MIVILLKCSHVWFYTYVFKWNDISFTALCTVTDHGPVVSDDPAPSVPAAWGGQQPLPFHFSHRGPPFSSRLDWATNMVWHTLYRFIHLGTVSDKACVFTCMYMSKYLKGGFWTRQYGAGAPRKTPVGSSNKHAAVHGSAEHQCGRQDEAHADQQDTGRICFFFKFMF